ncbi:7-carboxy-7-deazaguanine synthase [Candidatus Propionivibrio aalborgensis]|uniref:7-carboxy-7-deazaguanine synthase n=1 Tax=Candidatus Propionivibrio aalborgensis TaxID=1860101 RepID=A0A1A8XJG6_9RHOO|nr:7-carboxy-7-deazaguanine synthase QueE [Candidatus Propionivibrio aalborgensis]MBK9027688.1 7-carboxy-7-deazaguanine synthase QueE [Propionivibrio sp.]SBT04083.1 7-carboxy-7-deazaguanine synthase [Candidatus Propionivibrio aalborgensis]HRC61035.1 7-carboxy-7-deazaguanine synthase QueE [Candidatus Propionivibrio aalborgensis]
MVGSNNRLSLKVSEIFFSVQGESSRAGLPTVFVRLTGCPLRCVWCDTEYAFTGGQSMTLNRILEEVGTFKTRLVCVTGGEPLAQKNCLLLLTALCDSAYEVSLETSGAIDIAIVDPRVSRVVDLKAPGSGESGKNRWQNLELLTPHDELKFVIKDRTDYEWARNTIVENRLDTVCPVLFSPVQGAIEPRMLAEWILADRLPVRFQLQLHKLLWGNIRGK